MAKADYTKVEEALQEGLRRMQIDRLLDMSSPQKQGVVLNEQRKLLLSALRHELRYLAKMGKDAFEKSQFKKDQLIELLKQPDKLTEEEFKEIEAFKKHTNALKASLEKWGTEKQNEEAVEKKRKQEQNKRFNVSDKWMPL